MSQVHICRALSVICLLVAPLAPTQQLPPYRPAPSYLIELRGAEIPIGVAGMSLYRTFTNTADTNERKMVQRLRALQKLLQVDDAGFQALLEHMRSVLEQERGFQRAQASILCTRRRELTTVQQLGAALDTKARQLNIQREEFLQGAETVLGAAAKARLDALIDATRNSMAVQTIDLAQAMIEEQRSAAELLAALCDSAVSA